MVEHASNYSKVGFLEPVSLFNRDEAKALLDGIKAEMTKPPRDWDKGYAVSSRLFFEIATWEIVLDMVEKLIGKDIVLWGASLVTKPPGAIHPWHCDMECSMLQDGKAVSVWIGLDNIKKENSLQLISGSHLLSKTVQQIRYEKGISRMDNTALEVLEWAKAENQSCTVEQPDVEIGQALFFDGKIWHYSQNKTPQNRSALLLQYASPHEPIQIPEPNSYDWPFHFVISPSAPCILVRGDDRYGSNQIVNPPLPEKIKSRISIQSNRMHAVSLPLTVSQDEQWKPFYIFNGKTANLEHVTCHISSLNTGYSPHPPHQHREEELLIVLEGEVEVILPDLGGSVRQRLREGQFVYYPAFFNHTIETVSAHPANYLMIKWFNEAEIPPNQLPYQRHQTFEDGKKPHSSIVYSKIFEGPTGCLRKLHCHSTIIPPGVSYPAHIDPYDVAIIVLEGKVQSLGCEIGKGGVLFYPAGEKHGMSNNGDREARYVVFEFHRSGHVPIKSSIADEIGNKMAAVSSEKLLIQSQLLKTRKEIQLLKSSYSWKLGSRLIRFAMVALGWLPIFTSYVHRRVKAYSEK